MRSHQGFSIIELVIAVSLVGTLSAIALPIADTAVRRNKVTVGERMVADHLRAARLAAVSRNARVRVVFGCPGAGAIQTLTVTGNEAIDGAADRCRQPQPNDGPAVWLPADVTVIDPPILEFDGRGVLTPIGANAPVSLRVAHGEDERTLIVTGSGRVSGS